MDGCLLQQYLGEMANNAPTRLDSAWVDQIPIIVRIQWRVSKLQNFLSSDSHPFGEALPDIMWGYLQRELGDTTEIRIWRHFRWSALVAMDV